MFTVIDIETTGLNKSTGKLLEVAYARINPDCSIIGTGAMWFYDPEIPDFDVFVDHCSGREINGLTSEFLKPHKRDFYLNLAHLCTVIQGEYLIGKNLKKFDIPFLNNYLTDRLYRVDVDIPTAKGYVELQDFFSPIFKKYWFEKYGANTRQLGTLEDYIAMENISTDEINEQFKVMFGAHNARGQGAHSALYDVVMTYMILKVGINKYGLSLVKK